MPLDDDASPFERHAAEQERSSRSSRKSRTRRRVNEHIFAGAVTVTIQGLGWQSGGRYLPLQDDVASVAFWYQKLPHKKFPALPSRDELEWH